MKGQPLKEEYDHYWYDYAGAVVGDSQADDMVSYLKSSIGATEKVETVTPGNYEVGTVNGKKALIFTSAEGTIGGNHEKQ